eukprot:5617924-Pyramimonas_sp.AAC.2
MSKGGGALRVGEGAREQPLLRALAHGVESALVHFHAPGEHRPHLQHAQRLRRPKDAVPAAR